MVAKARVLIADRTLAIREALEGALSELCEVVDRVADGLALVEVAQRLKPDIVVTEIALPTLNGLEATRRLRMCAPQSKVIILTTYQGPVCVTAAFDAGACGYLLKRSCLAAELPQALLHVLAGDQYIGLGVRKIDRGGGSSRLLRGSKRRSIC